MPARTRKTTTPDPAPATTDQPTDQAEDTTSDLTPQAGGSLWTENGQADAHDATGPGAALSASQLAGLDLLRQPTPAHLLSLKPVNVRKDDSKSKCRLCGTYAGSHQHLTFAGHAAITDRLLAADPAWRWDPVPDPASLGLPALPGTLWIALTVCGVTRYGFGDSEGKTGPNAVKECIGDALRNAAMRFGVGLELWHKGDLHADHQEPPAPAAAAPRPQQAQQPAQEAAQAPAPAPADDQPRQPLATAQEYVEAMLATTSPAATVGLQREAADAGHLDVEVELPTSPPQRVTLLEAFTQRKRYLAQRQEAAAAQAAG